MNSFYGGKQGKSFIIAQTYSTIEEMVQSFGKNNIDCPVNFDEYALINTVNKNNPENGQIFRRGYDYNSDRKIISYRPVEGQPNPYEEFETEANGAVYIGTIVGPAGRAPIFNFGNYSTVQNICQIREKTFEDLGITYKKDLKYSEVVAVLNSKTQTHTDENGNIVIDEETGKPVIVFNLEETIDDFYTLKLTTPTNPNVVQYYCYDFRYGLNNQHSVGWYFIESVPTTGEDKFKPQEYNLIPGVTYDYDDNGNLRYEIDIDGRRHMKKGTNPVCPLNNNNENNPYQDTIDWTYCTVRNENLEDSTAYVGFRFASSVIEFEAESVDAYYNRSDMIGNPTAGILPHITNDFENLNLITRDQLQEDIEQHPFYSKWKINIPKGIKGESIHNLRVTTAAQEKVYAFKLDSNGNFVYNKDGKIQIEDYEGKDDDLTRPRQIIVFDYISYDRIKDGETYTIYLGDFNQISSVEFKHNGQLIFDYTHDNIQPIPSKDWVHWIDKMHFNEDGTVTITFNDLEWNVDQSEQQDKIENGVLTKPYLLHWINQMNFADDGTVTVGFNNEDLNNGQIENGHINLPKLVKWINKISLDKETGHLYIEFNNDNVEGLQTKNIGTEEEPKFVSFIEQDLTWVKDIEFQEDGTIITDYTTDYQENVDKRTQFNFIKWIKDISLDENTGHFIVNFNYDKEPDSGATTQINQFLTWIKDIRLDEDGTIHWDYTTDVDNKKIDNYLKWVKSVSLDDEGNFIMTFNYDTEEKPTTYRKSLTWVDDIQINKDNGQVTISYTNKDDDTDTVLTWVKDIKVNSDGTVTYYRTVDEITQTENPFTWITGFTVDEATGNFKINFNNNNKVSNIDTTLNYVVKMTVNQNNGDLLALYSDPQKRQTGYTYDDITGWTILGNIKYSKSMTKETYSTATPDSRVSNLMAGAVCYCIEEIE